MPMFGEDFRRCPACGHYEFEPHERVVLSKSQPPIVRLQDSVAVREPLGYVPQLIERRVVYVCANTDCRRELLLG